MTSAIVKLREQCLERGATGIIGLSRTFRLMDDNVDRKLDKAEFTQGLSEYGVSLSDSEVQELFNDMDKDGNGTIMFEEFLKAIRPPMSKVRLDIIDEAFKKMDRTGDGVVTIQDLRNVYNALEHPKFISGEMTEDEVFLLFLQNFEAPNNPDGKVTKQEFLDYYSGVSASIDLDEYFETMMKKAWKLD